MKNRPLKKLSSNKLFEITTHRVFVAFFLLVIFAFAYFSFQSPFSQHPEGHYGFWSIMPPLVAIVLAFWTREVVSSLFIGVCFGALIAGKPNVVEAFLIPSIGTTGFAMILLVYLWALGGLIGIWTRTGGARIFAQWAGRKMVRGPRSAKLFTWFMGLLFHQGGTISTVLAGATSRPVSDQNNISHEELAYIVDSTASPAATIIPFNVWPFYVATLVVGTLPLFPDTISVVIFFFDSIKYNFYALFAVLIAFLFAIDKLPWIPGKKMRSAIQRARKGEGLDRKNAKPLSAKELTQESIPKGYKSGLIDFLGPIGTLLGVAIIPFVITYFLMGQRSEPTLLIAEAFVLSLLVAISIALIKGMKLKDAIEGFLDGCKGVTIGALILALAVTLKEVATSIGTADYIIALVGQSITPPILPGILMILCMIIAFSTGTSWGTYAVVFPIAIPLAWTIVPDPFFLQLCFAAVIGGAVFGDQCSPISDTTILSSLSTGCDLVDHVSTQFPLALIAGIMAIISYAILVVFFIT